MLFLLRLLHLLPVVSPRLSLNEMLWEEVGGAFKLQPGTGHTLVFGGETLTTVVENFYLFFICFFVSRMWAIDVSGYRQAFFSVLMSSR